MAADGPSAHALREFAYGPVPDLELDGIDLAEDFHEASKFTKANASRLGGPASRFFLSVDDAHLRVGIPRLLGSGPRIGLAPPPATPIDLRDVTWRRRSRLPARTAAVTVTELGHLLGLACGTRPDEPRSRVVPSAGWLHPLDLFLICSDVAGLPSGGYLYDSTEHCLRAVAGVDPVHFWARTAINGPPRPPAVVVVIAATFARTRAKYGLRGYRFVLLEAGHVGQALVHTATALGLSSLPLGGVVDTEVDRILHLDGVDQSCVYEICISGPDLDADA